MSKPIITMTLSPGRFTAQLLIGLVGLVLLASVSWKIALGVFLCALAHNIERHWE